MHRWYFREPYSKTSKSASEYSLEPALSPVRNSTANRYTLRSGHS